MTSNGNILRGRKMFGRKMRKEAETWVAEIRCHKSSLCAFTRYIHTPRLSAPHFSANPARQSRQPQCRRIRKKAETWVAEIRCHKSSLCIFTRYILTPIVFLPHIFLPTPSNNPANRNAEGSAKRQKHGWQKYGAIKVRSAPPYGTFTPLVFLPLIFLPTPSDNPANRNAEGSTKRQKHGWQKYGAIKVRSAPSHGTSTPLVFLPLIFLPTPSDNPSAATQKDPQKGRNMGGTNTVP